MIRLEQSIATALAQRAEGEVDVAALVAGAAARGRRRLARRRRLSGAGAGLLAVLVATGLMLVSTGRLPAPHRAPAQALPAGTGSAAAVPSTQPTAWPQLPRPPLTVSASPSPTPSGRAAGTGSLVGTDRGRFHLDLTELPGPVTLAQWDSFVGWERLLVQTGAGEVQAEAAQVPDMLDPIRNTGETSMANGGTGLVDESAGLTSLRWRDGKLWLQVMVAGDLELAKQVAAGLRLDAAYRCTTPFRLVPPPGKISEEACRLLIDPAGYRPAATVGNGLWALTVTLASGGITPTTTVGRYPATVDEHPGDSGQIMEVNLVVAGHVVNFTAEGKYSRALILQVIGGYREVAPIDDPAAWAGGPLG